MATDVTAGTIRVGPWDPVTASDEPASRWNSPRLRYGIALGVLLVASLALRLWGIHSGLPYAYNQDENDHFVPHAIGMFGHGLNPHYFDNPPAFTYVIHFLFAIWYGSRSAVSSTFAANPGDVFLLARVASAVLGTASVGLLYLAGARLLGRRVGLLAAAILAVAFLPVFYAHLALNDAPALAPMALSLWGSAGVLRLGRRRDYAIAGIGLGLACATKYTAGIALAPLLIAIASQFVDRRKGVLIGIALAGALALAAFLFANPYALLDFPDFNHGLSHQSAGAAYGKLGLTHGSGIGYYIWSLGWTIGWVPTVAAAAGAVLLWRRDRRVVLMLAPVAVLFVIFMGMQGRYFGRWLMPVLPLLCLLAAAAAFAAVDWAALRAPWARASLVVIATAAVCVQGAVHSVHVGLVLSRIDTRDATRAWLVAHVAPGTRIVVEPVVPDQWVAETGYVFPNTPNGFRWVKFTVLRTQLASDGTLHAGAGAQVNIGDYEHWLRPELIDLYIQNHDCYVVTGSTQFGRAEVDPGQAPGAIAYYRALGERGRLEYEALPFAAGAAAVPFNFDWTFNYYPLAYSHPGPVMKVYRLRGGSCGR